MTSNVANFESDIRTLVALGDLDGALAFIRFLVDHVRFDPAATGLTLGSPALDRLCGEIGSLTLSQARQEASANPGDEHADVIIVATELYAVGGHSRVIADLIAASPDKRHLVLLSNFFDTAELAAADGLKSATTRIACSPATGRLEKLIWLQAQLARYPQAQVFLFNHHGDAAAIAAVQPGLNREVSFCHHADYHLCLGVHLDWVRHVDFFALCQRRCADAGIAADYWPLGVPDQGARSHEASSFGRGALLTTCCSGVWSKFDEQYPFQYADLIGAMLRASGGRHVHIGGIPAEGLARIQASLDAHGIDPTRFEHIPQVPSLWASLLDKRVDLYIGSFPFGGGRATTEALGAGIPIVTHRHQMAPELGAWGLGPAGTWSWATPAELEQLLSTLTPALLAERSAAARQHYVEHHSPSVFARCVRTGEAALPSGHAPSINDRLVSYLLRSALRHESHEPVFEELHKRLDAVRALAAQPTSTSAPGGVTMTQAVALYDGGKLDEAGAAFAALHARQSSEPQILVYLGLIALRSNMAEDASVFFDHAVDASQDRANTQAAIGQRCLELGQPALATHYLQGALANKASLTGAIALLADALEQQGARGEALALLEPMLQKNGELHPEILQRIMRLAAITGDAEMELAACRKARHHAQCHSRMLQLLSERSDTQAGDLLEETRRFAAAHAQQPRSTLPAGRRDHLRVGFVVGRIDGEALMQHLEDLLCELDDERFETLLFFDDIHDSERAQRFALVVDESHCVADMDATGAAQLVQARQTDVLINLEWHKHLPTLMIFAERAAPVQINHSRPARSSALPNMDYIISPTSGDFSEQVLIVEEDEDTTRYARNFGEALLSAWTRAGGSLERSA